MAIYRSFTIVS